MNYHPIMGITIFLFFLVFAFFLGKRFKSINLKDSASKLKERNNDTGSISPDAPWLERKDRK